jgi:antagonist of KipI
MTLQVIKPGFCTLVVDFGRPAARSLGVPVGGAADRASLALGNRLVDNPANTPALEVALAGPTLRAECSLGCVVFGAPFELRSSRQAVLPGKTFTLGPGEELQIGGTNEGLRAYLCVPGGFHASSILGSCSSLAPLAAGAKLPCSASTIAGRYFAELPFLTGSRPLTLRVLDGAQSDWFCREEFHAQEFTVAPASNRMGLRLLGKPLHFLQRELVSEPVCPGTVQVVRDGQCIILGVEAQTIGGYPKIAQVISADLDLLGQMRPGEPLRFARVTLEEAQELHERRQRELTRLAVYS